MFKLSSTRKLKFRRLCYQSVATYHPKVYTTMLPFLDGRAGIAWESPSSKMVFPLLEILSYSVLFTSTRLPSFLSKCCSEWQGKPRKLNQNIWCSDVNSNTVPTTAMLLILQRASQISGTMVGAANPRTFSFVHNH